MHIRLAILNFASDLEDLEEPYLVVTLLKHSLCVDHASQIRTSPREEPGVAVYANPWQDVW